MPIRTIALAIGLATLGVDGAKGDDRAKPEQPTISVSGTGKISATPDVAEISLGVVTQAASARDALSANNEAMNSLRQVLKQRGVAAKDIQTTQISVSPRYTQPVQAPQVQGEFVARIVGYDVTNTVQITAREIPRLGALLDSVVQAGANQIHGISFRIDQPEKLLEAARRRAMADAKQKAEVLAGEAGVVVGSPIHIEEQGGGGPPPRPMFGRMGMAAMAAPAPVDPGEQELSVTVAVVYGLEKPK